VWRDEAGHTSHPVVAAVVRRGDRLLLCQRPAGKRHAGLWEFPGGKLLEGETLGDAARRELAEELSLEVVGLGRYLGRHADPGAAFAIHFVEVEVSGEPVSVEHEIVVWAPESELLDYPLAPGDRAFVETWRPSDRVAPR
jgi:8-oxo-dGTP diphosphatase